MPEVAAYLGVVAVAIVQPPHPDSSGVALGHECLDLVGKVFGPAIPGNCCKALDFAPVPGQGIVWEMVET